MVQRYWPKEVELPNGRRFLARYKHADQNTLPANIRIHKMHRGITTQGRWQRVRRRAKSAYQIGSKGLKALQKKAFNFAKKQQKIQLLKN